MDMVTKGGKPVTAETLDRWAEVFERGEWPEGKTIPVGRPRLSTEELKPVTFKLTASMVSALDEKAASQGETRSEFLRNVVLEALTS